MESISANLDENGNAAKVEQINGSLDQDDSVTTVTIEKTVTTVTTTAVVTSEEHSTSHESMDPPAYEYIVDDSAHLYAEVTRKSSTAGERDSDLIVGGRALEDEDEYVNAGEASKEVTVTIERREITRSAASDRDDLSINGERKEDDESSVNITIVKTETESHAETSGRMTARGGYGSDDDRNDDEYMNHSEVTLTLHNTLNGDDDDGDDDDQAKPVLSISAEKVDTVAGNTPVTASVTVSTMDVNRNEDSIYGNDSEITETSIKSVTIVRTETTREEVEERSSEYFEGYLVPGGARSDVGNHDEEARLMERLEERQEEIEDLRDLREDYEDIQEIRKTAEIVETRVENTAEAIREVHDRREDIEEVREETRDRYEDDDLGDKVEAVREVRETVDGERETNYAHKTIAVTTETDILRVEVPPSAEQRTEIKTPTGSKSPSSSGLFVLRNAKKKDAQHFMQHIRDLANGPTNDLEKGEILTILRRSTSRDENNFEGESDQRKNRRSTVTNNLVKQFETASAGGGAVYPKSPTATTRSVSVEGKQSLSNASSHEVKAVKVEVNNASSDKMAEIRTIEASRANNNNNNNSDVTVVVKTTTVTKSTSSDKSPVVEKSITNGKQSVMSSEALAKQLELKLQHKDQQLRQKQELEGKQQNSVVVASKEVVASVEISSTSTNGDTSIVRPSTLVTVVRSPPSGDQTSRVGRATIQGPGIIPQWQLDLWERNKSKRSPSGSVTPTSPTNIKSATTPQSPPWLADLQMRNVKVTSITDGEADKK